MLMTVSRQTNYFSLMIAPPNHIHRCACLITPDNATHFAIDCNENFTVTYGNQVKKDQWEQSTMIASD